MAVRLEKQDSIGFVVLDRPPANSYDRAFMEELGAAADEAARDDSVKAIVVRSANERFFSAAAELLDRATERARAYATGPTFAIGRIKLATVQGFGLRLDEGLKRERQLLVELFKSEDAKEGVTAFVEKRKPNYKGR